MTDLRARIGTALWLAPTGIGLTWWLPTPWFGGALLAVLLLGLHEWNRLSSNSAAVFRAVAASMLVGAALLLEFVPTEAQYYLLLLLTALGALFWLGQALSLCLSGWHGCAARSGSMYAGALVLLSCWSALVWLHGRADGERKVVAALALVWAVDIAAFFVGRTMGKHKLAVHLSPSKTWEGALGGLLGAAVASLVLATYLLKLADWPRLAWLFACLLAALASLLGDLFESRLKRRAGIKDSGSLLPGHGGVLDRIDGLLAAMPVLVLSWWALTVAG